MKISYFVYVGSETFHRFDVVESSLQMVELTFNYKFPQN